MDITYIPMARGFVYLAAVVDWFSRRVLAWRLSITMEVDFCLDALAEALARHGRPEIFNTDHGSQFTSAAFTGLLAQNGIQISMDVNRRRSGTPPQRTLELIELTIESGLLEGSRYAPIGVQSGPPGE